MLEESDNEIEYTNKLRPQSAQDGEKFRMRSNKATRANRRIQKGGTPGSIRLRRNKHWSW
jgi:hypothetical protein